MKQASQLFSEEERKVIEDAVAQAENRTSGEIVPVVATASGRYDRAEDVFGFLLALTALCVAWWGFQDFVPAGGDWAQGVTAELGLPLILVVLIAGYGVGVLLATWFPVLRLPFIPKKEMREEVERAAAETFQKLRIRNTQEATGILIYVSLYERMVRVMGDDAISEKMDPQNWDDICNVVVDGIKQGKPVEGFQQGILQCGDHLSRHFPLQPGDVNELPNQLIILD